MSVESLSLSHSPPCCSVKTSMTSPFWMSGMELMESSGLSLVPSKLRRDDNYGLLNIPKLTSSVIAVVIGLTIKGLTAGTILKLFHSK